MRTYTVKINLDKLSLYNKKIFFIFTLLLFSVMKTFIIFSDFSWISIFFFILFLFLFF